MVVLSDSHFKIWYGLNVNALYFYFSMGLNIQSIGLKFYVLVWSIDLINLIKLATGMNWEILNIQMVDFIEKSKCPDSY